MEEQPKSNKKNNVVIAIGVIVILIATVGLGHTMITHAYQNDGAMPDNQPCIKGCIACGSCTTAPYEGIREDMCFNSSNISDES